SLVATTTFSSALRTTTIDHWGDEFCAEALILRTARRRGGGIAGGRGNGRPICGTRTAAAGESDRCSQGSNEDSRISYSTHGRASFDEHPFGMLGPVSDGPKPSL